ncbi:MAG: VWA domain-containing protein [Thermomicrobiales bacterium]
MYQRFSLHFVTAIIFLSSLGGLQLQQANAQVSQAAKTVNVELILDVSGSMAQVIDTGETRMDAAKRVIREVVNSIPEKEGINVGLRIYGFGGDNTDAGKPESCQSSELVAPINGVNKREILSQVESLQPTGWTPLALSLERAGEDFKTGENVTNAAVLITDGLETCGGDPCTVASNLHAADIQLTTHVIGFAVAPEEQATLGCIAKGGGGKLIGASNADELSSALFSVLEELQVVQGAGFIGGNALGGLPAGESRKLSVIAVGPYDGNSLPIVARNNTGKDIIRITAVATAKNPSGQVIGSGTDQLFNPNLVRSGGISFGYAYFGGIQFPADTTFDIKLNSKASTDDKFENRRDLEVIEASTIDGRVVGTLRNTYDVDLTGPITVNAACFDETGNLLSHQQSSSTQEKVAPGETVSFQVENFQTGTCPQFLVAGSAWDNTFSPTNSVEPGGTPTPSANQTPAGASTVVTQEPTMVAPLSTPAVDAKGCTNLTSAKNVLLALQASGLPIGNYVAYTAETDTNKLLGRPGQYIGKVNFIITSITSESTSYNIADGGSIEVFENAAQAKSRGDYVATVTQSTPQFAEYDFLEGTVLLRLSSSLTPDQAEVYKMALKEIISCPGSS